ncbi:uncharacterized protein MONOS_17002 [Monocercomonoides exilis]|uniref:uncharacterized protein n=1 Tax=Monocercomonoides exilis TaxID=2049356 RepID=UPI00355A7A72|nr:hypothetical protein MONOS_17002 [Monocercomonoides exilis]
MIYVHIVRKVTGGIDLVKLWRVKGGQVIGVRGICWGMLVGNSGVGARAPETKVTVCAQTVAARWAGCCWAPVYPSGWVAWLMWAEWAWGQWLQGWVVGVWLGWLAGRCGWGSGLWAVGRAGWVGCALSLSLKNLKYGKRPRVPRPENPSFSKTHRLNFTTPRLIAPQGQVSETSRCHRGSRCTLALHNGNYPKSWKVLDAIGQVAVLLEHANGAVGWACPAGTMWHTFGWWAVAGLRAVPEKVSIFH